MNYSKRQLYALGEPLGDCVTSKKAGRLICGGGGSGGGGSSTTTQEIPAELKPLATAYTGKAINLGNQSFQPYTGQRYADLDPLQYAGIGTAANRALGGSETINNAEGQLNNLIQGGATNPYLDQMVAKAQGSVVDQWNNMAKPQIESAMVNSGSFGNSGLTQYMQDQQKNTQKSLGDIATSMYGGSYDADRSRQMQAIGMAPQYGNMAYQDASQLLNAGQIMQDQEQNPLDFAYQQYQEEQNLPYKQLAGMSGVFGSNLGSTSTTQQSGGGGK
jgi:hypothetical protein